MDDYSIADIALLGWVRNLISFYEARELVGFDDFAQCRAHGWSAAWPGRRFSAGLEDPHRRVLNGMVPPVRLERTLLANSILSRARLPFRHGGTETAP